MFKAVFNSRKGIVRISDDGFYSVADLDRSAIASREAMDECRRQVGCVALLVICTSTIQDPEVMKQASSKTFPTFGPHDSAAFVIKSALARIQWNRFYTDPSHAAFSCEDAALAWLQARKTLAPRSGRERLAASS